MRAGRRVDRKQEVTMPRYLIERDVLGWTDEDLDAASLRAQMCAPWFEDLEWVISYHDAERGILLCIYNADTVEKIQAHSKFSGLPVGAIRPVTEIHPEDVEGMIDIAMPNGTEAPLEQPGV
jgi:hypothetical protein